MYFYKNKLAFLLIILLFLPTRFRSQNAYSIQKDSLSINFFDNPGSSVYPLNPYFMPLVFDGKISDNLTISLPQNPVINNRSIFPAFKPPVIPFLGQTEEIVRLRKLAYRDFLRNNIQKIKYTKSNFPKEVEQVKEIKPNIFKNLFTIEAEVEKSPISKSDRFVPKRKYWIRYGNSLLQFSQNYISKNWYNGGIGNLNLLSVQNYTVNYKKDKLQFNNFIEWKLSFYTNSNDTLRYFRMGDDLLRTYSDVGFKAFNDQWFYSSNMEIKTQLLRNYKENSNEYISSIFSPLQINLGILGMKYSKEKTSSQDRYKKHNISIDISPLSLQYTWVASKNIDIKRYGIEEGKNSLLDLGATLNAKVIIYFNRQMMFSSRLKYFTNYKKVIFESENELNISLNRFFSTRFYLYGRFDDSSQATKTPALGYGQLNELFSFGFNYKW
jgi:hypothetical protein